MTDPQAPEHTTTDQDPAESELAESGLVEEISVDGMCGVY
jgi:mycofactocin precursor